MNGGEDQLSLVNEQRKRAAKSSSQSFLKKVARPARPFITNCGTLLQIPAKKLHGCNVQIKEGNRYKVTEDKNGEKNPRLECKEKLNSKERQAVRNGEEIKKTKELLGEKRESLLSMNFDKVSSKQTKGECDDRRKDLGDMQKKQRPMTAEDIAMILEESDDDLSQTIVSSTDDSENERGKGPDSEALIKAKNNKKHKKKQESSKECDSDDTDDEHLARKKKSSKATSKLKEDSEDSDPTPVSAKRCKSKQNGTKKKEWEHFSDSDDEPLVKRKARTIAQKDWENVESSDSSENVSPDRPSAKRRKSKQNETNKKEWEHFSDSDDEPLVKRKGRTIDRKDWENVESSDSSENVSPDRPKGKRPKTSEKKEQRITEGKERRAEVARSEKVSSSYSEDSAEDNKLENKPVKPSIRADNDGTGKKKNAIANMEEHSDNSDTESENSEVQNGRHRPQRKDESSSSDDSSSKALMGKKGKFRVSPKEKDNGSFHSHPRALTKKKLKGKGIREKSRNSDSSEDEGSVKGKRNNSEQDFKKDELEKSCSDSEALAAELEKSFGSDSEALAAEPKHGRIKRPRKSCNSSESDDELVSGKRMKNTLSKASTRNTTSEESGDVPSKSKKFEKVGNKRKSQKDEDDSDCKSKGKGAVKNGKDSRSESFSSSDIETLVKVKSSNTHKENLKGKDKWKNSSDSDSDQEEDQKTKLPVKKETKKSNKDSSSSDSSPNSDGEEEPHKKIGRLQKEKMTNKSHSVQRNVKKSKIQSHGDDHLARLKKYIRLSGINIRNYDVLLEGCRSVKSKKEKLLQVMHDHGLKGKPTQEKCKKLKKRNDQIKELEDLDMSNIISHTGRGQRKTFSLYASQTVSHPKNDFLSPVKPSKARLIVDSDSE